MNKLSRRSLLQKMARMSMLAATAPWIPEITGCRAEYGTRITLNVVLHGLFILNFTDVNIELFTPLVEDHIYRAGNWDWKTLTHLLPTKPHERAREYELLGVESLKTAPPVDSEYNIVPRESSYQLRPECSVFTIHLPFPRKISLIRRVTDKNSTATCPSPSPSPVHILPISRLSLCQVLTYSVPDYRKLALSDTSWSPCIDPATQTANLHIWAEPPLRLGQDHACHAYGKLSEMLAPLQFQLLVTKTAPLDLDTGVCGLPPEQEQGLSEWMSGGEGSFPTNCSTVMLGVKPI